MSYLLDTNIISELVKIVPTQAVVNWVNSKNTSELYISVITLGEIRKGVEGIANLQKKEEISKWLEFELPSYFEERILTIDKKISDIWGRLQSKRNGRVLPAIDGLIAATAHVHGLKLVTRNTKDFLSLSIELINPWE